MNTHIINRQIIELKVNSEEHAFGLQQQVRDAYMTNVLPLIGEVLDELVGPDEVLRIDRIELDFGNLVKEKMGEQMKERVREALFKQLPKLQRKNANAENQGFNVFETGKDGKENKVKLVSESFSQREMLSVYFETGSLPWWAGDEAAAPDIDEIIIALFEKEPVTTLQWLQQLAVRSPQVIKRIVLQLEKPTRQYILRSFPTNAISTLRKLTKQLQLVNVTLPFFNEQKTEEGILLFAALILPDEVLHNVSSVAVTKTIETFFTQLAVIYQSAQSTIEKQVYADTLSALIAAPEKAVSVPALVEYFVKWEKAHMEIVISVTGESVRVMETIAGGDHATISELADAIEAGLIKYEEKRLAFQSRRIKFFRKGTTRAKHKTDKSSEQNITIDSGNKISFDNKTEQLENRVEEKKENKADKTNPSLSELPADTDQTDVNDDVVKINWFKAKNENDVPEPIPGKIDIVSEKVNTSENKISGQQVSGEQPTTAEKTKVEETTAVLQNTFAESPAPVTPEETDEEEFIIEEHPLKKNPAAGMTRFGGLVLIAPFLHPFFTELKLIADGVFVNEAAQHKAVHILNFLTTGKTSAPEHTLLLHKLLCGIELTQPVPKSVKLSADEKKEATLFLDDIAEQWTALRTTSGKVFRDTFFRRNGILEKRDNIWLLRVERGPVDVMLDTLPWTISIIRAPWMQQLLQTEW